MPFQAARRMVALIAAGDVPPEVMRQAAAGTLSLPAEDRLALLVYLAAAETPHREAARAALRSAGTAVTELLARADCPEFLRAASGSAAAPLRAPAESEPELDDEQRALLQEAAGESGPFALVEASEEEQAALAEAATAHEGETRAESLLNRLAKLSVPERARRAMLGSREERLFLARDANKTVQRAVVNSPRLTESDVEVIAGMRNVGDEVLRLIGTNRRWRQSLAVIRNLTSNPRTPLELSLRLVKHLFPNDLRLLANNKNVSEMVRRMATKLLAQRQS